MTDDLIDNPSTRCPVALVLDTSASMRGEPIALLNEGANLFVESVKEDELARWSVDLAVFTFGESVRQVLDFTPIEHIVGFAPLTAGGLTPMGAAVNLALDALEARKALYRQHGVPYYQPWLVLISDGAPTDSWQDAAQRARDLSSQRKLLSLPLGVEGADLDILGQFSAKGALRLQGLKFREFFMWLSASLARVSASSSSASTVALPPRDLWAEVE